MPEIVASIGAEMVVKTTTKECPACAALREKSRRRTCMECQRLARKNRNQRHKEKGWRSGTAHPRLPRAARSIVEVAEILGISCSAVINAQGSAIRKIRASREKSLTDLCEEAVVRWKQLAVALDGEGLVAEAEEVRRIAQGFAAFLWDQSVHDESGVEVVLDVAELIGGVHDD